MMIPDRLIDAFVRASKAIERMADIQDRQVKATEAAVDLQRQMIEVGTRLQADIDDTPDDVKFIADLRKWITGLGKDDA
jgi:predicted transcriptional regulator